MVGLCLVLIPLSLAWFDHMSLRDLFAHFRAQFVYAAIVVYVLLLVPLALHSRDEVAEGLRPLIELDDEAYQKLVAEAGRIRPRSEIIAFICGVAFGWVINVLFEPLPPQPNLLDRYAYLSRLLIFGVNVWALFILFSVPRVTRTLTPRVTHPDVFDIAPFAPIGRQSLMLAAGLLGGTLLGLLSSALGNRVLWNEYLIVYSLMLAAICAIFLINTLPAHRVIADAKQQQLNFIDRSLATFYYVLQEEITQHNDARATAAEINALAVLKEQLVQTRTWPYNTQALRALTVTVLSPLIIGLARIVGMLLTDG